MKSQQTGISPSKSVNFITNRRFSKVLFAAAASLSASSLVSGVHGLPQSVTFDDGIESIQDHLKMVEQRKPSIEQVLDDMDSVDEDIDLSIVDTEEGDELDEQRGTLTAKKNVGLYSIEDNYKTTQPFMSGNLQYFTSKTFEELAHRMMATDRAKRNALGQWSMIARCKFHEPEEAVETNEGYRLPSITFYDRFGENFLVEQESTQRSFYKTVLDNLESAQFKKNGNLPVVENSPNKHDSVGAMAMDQSCAQANNCLVTQWVEEQRSDQSNKFNDQNSHTFIRDTEDLLHLTHENMEFLGYLIDSKAKHSMSSFAAMLEQAAFKKGMKYFSADEFVVEFHLSVKAPLAIDGPSIIPIKQASLLDIELTDDEITSDSDDYSDSDLEKSPKIASRNRFFDDLGYGVGWLDDVYVQLLLASGMLCCGWYFYVYRKVKNKEIDRLKDQIAKSKENDLPTEIEQPGVDAKSLTFQDLAAENPNPLAVKARSMSVEVHDKIAPETDLRKLQSQEEAEKENKIKTLTEENQRLKVLAASNQDTASQNKTSQMGESNQMVAQGNQDLGDTSSNSSKISAVVTCEQTGNQPFPYKGTEMAMVPVNTFDFSVQEPFSQCEGDSCNIIEIQKKNQGIERFLSAAQPTTTEIKMDQENPDSLIVTRQYQINLNSQIREAAAQGGFQENYKMVVDHKTGQSQVEIDLDKFQKKLLETGRYESQFEDLGLIGKGGFGTVNKAQHLLEGTIYAVKKVRVHLSTEGNMIEQLREHKTYREVLALSNANLGLKHTVRYYTSWFENLSKDEVAEELAQLKQYMEKQERRKQRRLLRQQEKKCAVIEEEEESYGDEYYDSEGDDDEFMVKRKFNAEPVSDCPSEEFSEKSEADFVSTAKKTQNKSKSDERLQVSSSANQSSMYSESDYTESSMTQTDQFDSKHSLVKYKERNVSTLSLNLFIQMEFCIGDNLQIWLDERRRVTKDLPDDVAQVENRAKAFRIFRQMLEGVISMHKNKIVHRDLKPQNVFLDHDSNVKLGDFGLAKATFDEGKGGEDTSTAASESHQLSVEDICSMNPKSSQQSNVAGTMRYMAPEWQFTDDEEITAKSKARREAQRPKNFEQLQKIDIFALGIILSDLLCNPPTFMVSMRIDRDLKANKPKLPPGYGLEGSPEGRLLLALVEKDPTKRPTGLEIEEKYMNEWEEAL